jgi:transcriptional regulator MraZ
MIVWEKTMLLGKYIIPIKTNRCFAIPPDVLKALSRVVYITQGFDRNLLLMTKSAFETTYSHVRSASITDPLSRLLSRLFLGNAVEMEIDPTGIIEIPIILYEFAGFEEDIVVVGQGEYLELWASSSWNKQSDILQDYGQNYARFEKFNVSLA